MVIVKTGVSVEVVVIVGLMVVVRLVVQAVVMFFFKLYIKKENYKESKVITIFKKDEDGIVMVKS